MKRYIAFLVLFVALAGWGCDSDRPPATAPREPTADAPAARREATPARSPTPAGATPTATAVRGVPQASHGAQVGPLQVGDEAELPRDVALIVETGCFQCDGPTAGLVRVYRDRAGKIRTDTLFARPEGPSRPYISGFALSPDGAEIAVGVCSRGHCGPVAQETPDAQTTLFRSLDGGVTWSELAVLNGAHGVVAIGQGGVIVSGPFQAGTQAAPPFRVLPQGRPLTPPPGASAGRPISLPGGDLLWRTEDGRRVVRGDGGGFLDLNLGDRGWIGDLVPDATGERFAVSWGDGGRQYVGVVGRDGRLITTLSSGENTYAAVGAWLSSTLLVGNVTVSQPQLRTAAPQPFSGLLPAIFDLQAGRVSPIPIPFLDSPFRNGRNRIQATLRGPFARVASPGDCLNVRAEPGAAAKVVTCAADGVLLRDTGETREQGGATWLRVVTPSGQEGWASAAYLER